MKESLAPGECAATVVDDATYEELVGATRRFLDALAAAVPDATVADDLTGRLRDWTKRLADRAAGAEHERLFGRRPGVASHGQAMTPAYRVTAADDVELSGVTCFGGFFLGGNGAAHGGAVPLLFDELFGRVINGDGRPPARTAYLHVDFRAVVRLDRDLDFRVWRDRREGRKQYVRGEIRDGGVVCAEAEALFVELRPGQP
ncbi:hotdog fold domain-containing protein [Nocardioides sp. LHD-245]|uniref:hotdog fold domain-containing protein n=1 Tax=Nocardioides sp. LHD-245 TaxID=3051387 RepID=UPI0027DED714|nr:hotdog fold domain-containing protein [Nocardioides sp. LHD-245]